MSVNDKQTLKDEKQLTLQWINGQRNAEKFILEEKKKNLPLLTVKEGLAQFFSLLEANEILSKNQQEKYTSDDLSLKQNIAKIFKKLKACSDPL